MFGMVNNVFACFFSPTEQSLEIASAIILAVRGGACLHSSKSFFSPTCTGKEGWVDF